jgi:hypothetical protein
MIDYIKEHPFIIHVFVYILIVISIALVFIEQQNSTNQRIDETCQLFEADHKADVEALVSTYNYLNQLRPKEADDTINQTIITNLPQLEREARTDTAPPFCDEPNRGLPEPDPEIPTRQDFSHLLLTK